MYKIRNVAERLGLQQSSDRINLCRYIKRPLLSFASQAILFAQVWGNAMSFYLDLCKNSVTHCSQCVIHNRLPYRLHLVVSALPTSKQLLFADYRMSPYVNMPGFFKQV